MSARKQYLLKYFYSNLFRWYSGELWNADSVGLGAVWDRPRNDLYSIAKASISPQPPHAADGLRSQVPEPTGLPAPQWGRGQGEHDIVCILINQSLIRPQNILSPTSLATFPFPVFTSHGHKKYFAFLLTWSPSPHILTHNTVTVINGSWPSAWLGSL